MAILGYLFKCKMAVIPPFPWEVRPGYVVRRQADHNPIARIKTAAALTFCV